MEKKITKLKNIAKPVADFLRKNYNPHTSIVITADYIRVVSDEVGIPINETPVDDTYKIKEIIAGINKIAMDSAKILKVDN